MQAMPVGDVEQMPGWCRMGNTYGRNTIGRHETKISIDDLSVNKLVAILVADVERPHHGPSHRALVPQPVVGSDHRQSVHSPWVESGQWSLFQMSLYLPLGSTILQSVVPGREADPNWGKPPQRMTLPWRTNVRQGRCR